jgi:uncharacterized phiE125 gp8 family phage protein
MVFTKGSKTTVAPTSEPFLVAEAKEWLKVDSTADDSLITALIAATREHIESSTGLALFTQTITETLDSWPLYEEVSNPFQAFNLLRYPVQSISSIAYTDSSGDSQTLASSKYVLDSTSSHFARVGLAAGQTWPGLSNRIASVTVTYVAGWSSVEDIPEDLIIAMKLLLTYFYEKRADSVRQFKTTADFLISKHYINLV